MKKILFAISLCSFLVYKMQAQIIYVDLVPDYFQNVSGNKSFDLNKDGTDDLQFSLTIINPQTDVWFTLNTLNNTEVWIDSTNFNSVKRLENGSPVSSDKKWKNDSNIPIAYLTSGSTEGPWPGSSDKYLAFRLKNGSNYYYGWMRMSVHNMVNNFTIKDYAYQSTANTPIGAGDKFNTSVNNSILNPDIFHYTVSDDHILVQSQHDKFTVSMYNLSGQLLSNTFIPDDKSSLDVSGLQTGIYIISFKNESGSMIKKIYIQ